MLDKDQYEALNREQERFGGITLSDLKPGMTVVVKTLNNTYTIETISGSIAIVQGGKYFKKPTRTVFSGSSWEPAGKLKVGWIGFNMHMEIMHTTNDKIDFMVSSLVREAKVTGSSKDGKAWEYDLDWPSDYWPVEGL